MKHITLICAALLTGCATSSNKISAAYASPMMFQGYSCDQLVGETFRIRTRVNALGVDLDSKAKSDNIAMGVGMLLFWPALFMVKGDDSTKGEYARLKGEYDAIQQAANMKNCSSQQTAQPAYTPPSTNGSTPTQQPYQMDPAKRCDACQRIGKP